MTDAPEPHTVGSHGLGPHVVGQRVVVRHLLPDGRATDVLGTCTSWGADAITIDRDGHFDQAGPITIALADIVTGKPVPPRASVRARVSAQEVERHIAALWPGMTTEPLGTWTLRASPPIGGRLRRRGNSALAMEEPGIGWADAAWRVREFYTALEQTPMIQVQRESAIEDALATLGFAPMGDGDAHCQLASVAQALRSCNCVSDPLPVRHDGQVVGRTHSYMEGDDRVLVTYGDGAGIASGRGVLSDDWLLIESLVVDRAERRRGLATAVMAELLDWGASQGARTAMLHVETANPGAIALYERHGFVTHHTNRYLVG